MELSSSTPWGTSPVFYIGTANNLALRWPNTESTFFPRRKTMTGCGGSPVTSTEPPSGPTWLGTAPVEGRTRPRGPDHPVLRAVRGHSGGQRGLAVRAKETHSGITGR